MNPVISHGSWSKGTLVISFASYSAFVQLQWRIITCIPRGKTSIAHRQFANCLTLGVDRKSLPRVPSMFLLPFATGVFKNLTDLSFRSARWLFLTWERSVRNERPLNYCNALICNYRMSHFSSYHWKRVWPCPHLSLIPFYSPNLLLRSSLAKNEHACDSDKWRTFIESVADREVTKCDRFTTFEEGLSYLVSILNTPK